MGFPIEYIYIYIYIYSKNCYLLITMLYKMFRNETNFTYRTKFLKINGGRAQRRMKGN